MPTRLIEHLEKLRYFRAVAQSTSLQKASRRIGISQPALTRSIGNLEAALEVSLFVRSTQGMELTPAGRKLLEFSNELFHRAEDWQQGVRTPEAEPPVLHSLRIGTYVVLACTVLPTLFAELEARHATQNLGIVTERSNAKLVEKLHTREVDYLLMAEPQRQRGLDYRLVRKERYGFYASQARYREWKLGSRTLAELRRFRLLTFPEAIAGQNRNVDRLLWETSGLSATRFDSMETAKYFAVHGIGIGILPTTCVWAEVAAVQLVEIKGPHFPKAGFGPHGLYLVCRAENADSSDHRALLAAFRLTGERMGPA